MTAKKFETVEDEDLDEDKLSDKASKKPIVAVVEEEFDDDDELGEKDLDEIEEE